MKPTHLLAALTLALSISPAVAAYAQSAQAKTENPAASESPANPLSPAAEVRDYEARSRIQTLYLTNVSQQNEANEILVALRNLLPPYIHLYFVASQDAIVIRATPEQLVQAESIIHALDRPGKSYRLTYTITDLDNGQRVGTEHYSMVVVTGQETTLKQGEKVPIATGSFNTQSSASQTQFTYIDVGMNFDATVFESANNVRLQSKVEQSSIAQQSTIAGVQEPVVRQTALIGTSFLTPNKPLILGTLDIAGTTRRVEISVAMDQVP